MTRYQKPRTRKVRPTASLLARVLAPRMLRDLTRARAERAQLGRIADDLRAQLQAEREARRADAADLRSARTVAGYYRHLWQRSERNPWGPTFADETGKVDTDPNPAIPDADA